MNKNWEIFLEPEVKELAKLNDDIKKAFDKPIAHVDKKLLQMHVGVGISCILVALACFFLLYCIIKIHG